MQSWIEIRVLAPAPWAELVGEVLGRRSAGAVAFGRPNRGVEAAPEGIEWVRAFVDSDEDGPALRAELEAELAGMAALLDAPELQGLEPTYRDVPNEDWETSWRKSWKPFRVGHMAVITYDWEGELRPTDVPLRLEPAGSFGTGRHPTTRACLAFLQELDLDGCRVLDAGTGTGILSVAAALLGAKACRGFDIDTRSAKTASDLAARNGVAERCTFHTGDLAVVPNDEPVDVLLANIYADVIQEHAVNLAARLRPGGCFAFSGCPEVKREPTERAIRDAGLTIERTVQRGRWVTTLGSAS